MLKDPRAPTDRQNVTRARHSQYLLLSWLVSSACLGTASQAETRVDRSKILDALAIVSRVPAGRALLKKAQAHFGEQDAYGLIKVFQWGRVSRTDAVLTRHFDPVTELERRDRQVTVYLKRDEAMGELVLDVAHELTHAIASPEWDPYDPALTPARYVQFSIDGDGGEVDAVITECHVSLELADRYGVSDSRCRTYLDENHEISREKVRQEFYRVGRDLLEIKAQLGESVDQLPLLSDQAPTLFSSTGRAPYPTALLREFAEMTQIACENTKRRIEAGPTRRLARFEEGNPTAAAGDDPRSQVVFQFLTRRCGLISKR